MKPSKAKVGMLLLLGGALLALGGCGVIGANPWDRDLLARKSMQWDADGVDAAIDDHVYFSKEASTGGRSYGGGGCGCN